MAPYHLELSFKQETIHSCTLTSCAKRTHTLRHFYSPPPSLFYTRSREKISLYWDSRNEWQIEIWVTSILAHLHHTLRPFVPLIFSLQLSFKRENYIHHYYPFRGTPEMSDKLRYESQIILRYYAHIIYEVSLEWPTTSTCKTIYLERKTTPHFLSHWATHLQYWWKDYAYSRTQ